MGTTNTAVYDQQLTRPAVSRLVDANILSGEVEFAIIPHTVPSNAAANDIINLCLLPAGAVPVPALSKIVRSGAATGSLTLDVGTATVPDGWFDGVVPTGAVEVSAAGTTPLPAWAAQTPLAADSGGHTLVQAKVVASTLSTTAALYFVLAYKRGR